MAVDDHVVSVVSRAVLAPTSEEQFENVEVYAEGISDPVATGRHLTIQKISPQRWVGSIDADLSSYYGTELKVRVNRAGRKTGSFPVAVGPRIRGETLLIRTKALA